MEKTVAFVVARLDSSRLPAKQLRTIGGKSILSWLIENLREAREINQIVLATVAEEGNLPLKDFAEQNGIDLFWYQGDINHVTTRLRRAGEEFGAGICLLISADCPLVHGPSIDLLVKAMKEDQSLDFTMPSCQTQGWHSLLEGVQAARLSAWQKADDLSDRPELKEHQFPVIYRSQGLFKGSLTQMPEEICGPFQRMSVDTWADLEFMEALHEQLKIRGLPFRLPHACQLLKQERWLAGLNAHVYQRKLVEDIKKVLFVCDAGGEFGYGHFMRSRELAGQVVERLSWPVTFMLDDAKATEMAYECGFATVWGALERPARGGDGAVNLSSFDLVVVDVSARRKLGAEWRNKLFAGVPVAVLDRDDVSPDCADLAVFLGPTTRNNSGSGIKTLSGPDFVIIPRGVKRYKGKPKDIDLLAYLYSDQQRSAVKHFAQANSLEAVVLDGFTPDFLDLLARSKVFISGYGQSFYEALTLNAMPVAWPLSALHRADAKIFYEASGLPQTIVESESDLPPRFEQALGAASSLKEIPDGTPNIVEELRKLVTGK